VLSACAPTPPGSARTTCRLRNLVQRTGDVTIVTDRGVTRSTARGWLADTFAPVNSVTVLLDASRAAPPSDTAPVVLADAGVENVNAQVDALIHTGVLRRLSGFTYVVDSVAFSEQIAPQYLW
jgi:hypothetical protein